MTDSREAEARGVPLGDGAPSRERRAFVGVVYLRALPSAGGGAFDAVLDAALRDAEALARGGADGLMLENFGDAPFHKGTRDDPVPPDVPAALAVAAREARLRTGLPVGVNCLRNDGIAALAAAVVAGARWVRVNVLAGAYLTDQGVIEGEAARIAAFRRRIGAHGDGDGGVGGEGGVRLLADLLVKHATPLQPLDPALAARDLAERSGADALVLSGARTGLPVDTAMLRTVREAVGAFPVWLGSGLHAGNAAELWPLCDGAIVGTALKANGDVRQPVDVERVRRLRQLLA